MRYNGTGRMAEGRCMEKLLEKFNMKPNPSELEATRVFLQKDYELAIERLETSPLKQELPVVKN